MRIIVVHADDPVRLDEPALRIEGSLCRSLVLLHRGLRIDLGKLRTGIVAWPHGSAPPSTRIMLPSTRARATFSLADVRIRWKSWSGNVHAFCTFFLLKALYIL